MKYIKRGVATLIPLLLVIQVVIWVSEFALNTIKTIMGEVDNLTILIILTAFLFTIFFLGWVMTHVGFIKRSVRWVEKHTILKIPMLGTIYNFGSDIVDTFTADIKDNQMTVVEIDLGGFKALGVLTDKKNGIGFLISAPSPLTGVVLKLPNYKILDLTFIEAVQINSSLGRIGGDKWE